MPSKFNPVSKLDPLPPYVNTVQALRDRSIFGARGEPPPHKLARRVHHHHYSLGFTPYIVQRLEKVQLLNHRGCVNCANFNSEGSLLATGSDDLKLKIWEGSFATNDVTLKHSIESGHHHNVFHVGFNPADESKLASCAADGEIRLYDLASANNSGSLVADYPAMVNMFAWAPNASWNGFGDVLFSATYATTGASGQNGCVEMHDLRTNSAVRLLSVGRGRNVGHVKAVDTNPFDPNLVVVGVGEKVWTCDVRRPGECIVQRWSLFNESVQQLCRSVYDAMMPFAPLTAREDYPPELPYAMYSAYALANRVGRVDDMDVAVSSLAYSQKRREILVSFQGDSIYTIPSTGDSQDIIEMYAGALNEKTFLKRSSFFGPNEEYVCAGSDDGNVYIWDRESARLVSVKPADRFATMSSSEDNGEGIVNGVVPHPVHCALVSYGLDRHAKLHAPYDIDRPQRREGNGVVDVAYDEFMFDSRVAKAADVISPPPENSFPLERYIHHALASNQRTACHANRLGGAVAGLYPLFLARTSRLRDDAANDDDDDGGSSSLLLRWLDRRSEQVDNNNNDNLNGSSPPPPPPSTTSTTRTKEPERLSPEWFLMLFEYAHETAAKLRERGNALYQQGGEANDDQALRCYAYIVCICAGAELLGVQFCLLCKDEVIHCDAEAVSQFSNVSRPLYDASEKPQDPDDSMASLLRKDTSDLSFTAAPDLVRRMCELAEKLGNLVKLAYLNAAATCLRNERYKHGAVSCSESALSLDPTNFKARYRLALACIQVGKYSDALRELERLSQMPGGDKPIIKQAMDRAKRSLAESRRR